MQGPAVLETERLVLRRSRESDAPSMLAYCSDPIVMRFMHFRAHATINEVYGFLESCAERWASGDEYCWVVTVKPDDSSIGHIAIRVHPCDASFGYLFRKESWGFGFATEAARAVVQTAFSNPAVSRVWATCDVDNVRSTRVLQKVGLELEERRHLATIRPNISTTPRDELLYSRSR